MADVQPPDAQPPDVQPPDVQPPDVQPPDVRNVTLLYKLHNTEKRIIIIKKNKIFKNNEVLPNYRRRENITKRRKKIFTEERQK